MNAKLLILLAALLPGSAWAGAEHPLFEAFPRSTLDDLKVKEFDEYDFPVSQLNSGRHIKVLPLEGKFTKIEYRNPPERATLELMRNYETALKETGFSTIYSCKGRACGDGCVTDKGLGWHCVDDENRFFSGKLVKNGGEVYLALLVTPSETKVSILEAKAMTQSLAGAGAGAVDEAPAPKARAAAPSEDASEAPAPAPTPGASKEVTAGVIKGLSQLGMQARVGAATTSGADIIVEGTTETRPVDTAGDKRWKFARSTASITLKDGQTGRAFLSFEASDRQASGDFKEAARRSRVELAKKVADQVHSAITEYFENQ